MLSRLACGVKRLRASQLGRLPVPDLLQDGLEHPTRGEHVLAREQPGALGAAGGDRLADRAVLEVVLLVEVVDVEPGRPHDVREEAAARALGAALDETVGVLGSDPVGV